MQGRLLTLRIIWAALLMGQAAFLVVVLMIGPNNPPQDKDFSRVLLYIAVVMLAALVPVAYVVRATIYRTGRRDDGTVAGGAYATGNIIFWAMCEGVGMFALVGALLSGGRGPHLFVALIAMAVQIVNVPIGAALSDEDR